MADFTVYEDIISNGEEWLRRDDANDLVVATFAYNVDMSEIRERRPEAVAAWEKVIDNETFKAGDELHYDFATLVRNVAEEHAYEDFKEYTRVHALPDPVWHIRVVLNNPNCFPSADERRKREGEALGRYLGILLGIGRRN